MHRWIFGLAALALLGLSILVSFIPVDSESVDYGRGARAAFYGEDQPVNLPIAVSLIQKAIRHGQAPGLCGELFWGIGFEQYGELDTIGLAAQCMAIDDPGYKDPLFGAGLGDLRVLAALLYCDMKLGMPAEAAAAGITNTSAAYYASEAIELRNEGYGTDCELPLGSFLNARGSYGGPSRMLFGEIQEGNQAWLQKVAQLKSSAEATRVEKAFEALEELYSYPGKLQAEVLKPGLSWQYRWMSDQDAALEVLRRLLVGDKPRQAGKGLDEGRQALITSFLNTLNRDEIPKDTKALGDQALKDLRSLEAAARKACADAGLRSVEGDYGEDFADRFATGFYQALDDVDGGNW